MMALDIDPLDVDVDPRILGIVDVGLDPKKTLDFAVLQILRCRFILPPGRPTKEFLKVLKSNRGVILPPLNVIRHKKKDLVETAWGWKRLLPWMRGSVLFEDYFTYLQQYYQKNIKGVYESFKLEDQNFEDPSAVARLNAAAATGCLEAEHMLSGILDDDPELNKKIVEEASRFENGASTLTVPATSIVPAACFMCITEEAKLMYVLCTTKADEFPVELRQEKLEFCTEVRRVALYFLTTYKGSYSKQVSAAILGMKMETSTAHAHLLAPEAKRAEQKLYLSEEIRHSLLKLLILIQERFPPGSHIDYDPIARVRTALKKHESNEVSPDDIPIPKTLTNSAAPLPRNLSEPCNESESADVIAGSPNNIVLGATPSWSLSDYESDQSNTSGKTRKSIGGILDSVTLEDLGIHITSGDVVAHADTIPVHSSGESDDKNNKDKKRSKSAVKIQGMLGNADDES
ncbi:hypothetical protein CFC21_097867 [Triticum aestivum]|uniref:Uncharacterized protein n=2 Tax=Triticum aestivum TaxID=4565 RepID=A0A9R1LVE7_WHEAT|nr:uncharacterized protein LOC123150064 [Triticum aestivum]KAF7095780.1 hypothetical protein CFC21_097867 [Triticum aestivum]